MEPHGTRGQRRSGKRLDLFLYLLNGLGVQLLRVLGDNEKQEGRIHTPGQDELEHHRPLNVRQALVLLWRWEATNEPHE